MAKISYKFIHFIVLFSFLMNSFFGYAYVNIIIAGIPLNEIALILSLIFCFPLLPVFILRFPIIKPILLWSVLFVPFVLWGFFQNGKWALRDATHLIEVWWIPVSIVALSRVTEVDFKKYLNLFVILTIIKSLMQFFDLEGVLVIEGLHSDLDLLESGSTGMAFMAIIAFWGYISGLHRNYLIIPITILGLVLGQSRTGIFSMILLTLVYLFLTKAKLNILLKLASSIFVLAIIYSTLANIPELGKYTKFKKLLTIEDYYELMLSSSGESKTFSGSAAGVNQRNGWRDEIFNKAENSLRILFLGQGFGVPLTDLISVEGNPVREPHNSSLSVFARTGIIGFIVWFVFHFKINSLVIKFLSKNSSLIRHNFMLKLLLVCYLSLINMYVTSLSQPGFENPFWAVPAFIVIGAIIVIHKKTQIIVNNAGLKNINRNAIV